MKNPNQHYLYSARNSLFCWLVSLSSSQVVYWKIFWKSYSFMTTNRSRLWYQKQTKIDCISKLEIILNWTKKRIRWFIYIFLSCVTCIILLLYIQVYIDEMSMDDQQFITRCMYPDIPEQLVQHMVIICKQVRYYIHIHDDMMLNMICNMFWYYDIWLWWMYDIYYMM